MDKELKSRVKTLIKEIKKQSDTDRSLQLWQMERLVEESSELIQAIMKVIRYPSDKKRIDNLHEELSHVYLCVGIVKEMFDKKEFNSELDAKVSQLERSYGIARKD